MDGRVLENGSPTGVLVIASMDSEMSHMHTTMALTGHIHLLCNFTLDELPMHKIFTAIIVHVLYITCKYKKTIQLTSDDH
jgi:hypothetical protein